MAIDPEIAELLKGLASLGLPAFSEVDVATLRSTLSALAAGAPPGPEVETVRDEVATFDNIKVPIRTYLPHGKARALLLFFHGGGWTLGSIEESDIFARTLATRLHCAVMSVGYRLAPEHPFPAAVEDARAAAHWAASQASVLYGHALPLVTVGDSAGANLAAVVSSLAGKTLIANLKGQILLNPAVDGDIDDARFNAFVPPFLSKADIGWFYDQYVPDRQNRTDPRFAPSRAPDLRGSPPTFVLTAENDLLNVEGERYARLLTEAGIFVTAKRYRGAVHSWVTLHPGLALSMEALDDMDRFLGGVLNG